MLAKSVRMRLVLDKLVLLWVELEYLGKQTPDF